VERIEFSYLYIYTNIKIIKLNNMEECFICGQNLKELDFYLIPVEEDYIGQDISIFKNTFIIKSELSNLKFIYYNSCIKCLNSYININQKIFKYIKNREIGKKIL